MNHPARSAAGFTLVELLVVISIIMVIAGFGITKLISMRQDAALVASQERLGQIHFQLSRYEAKKKTLPKASGSEFVMSIWGRPYIEKSVNNAGVMFCESLARPELSEETLDEDVTAGTIHWAGRNQGEKRFRIGRMNARDSSKKIVACNKPLVYGEMPHQGDNLAVVYLNGALGAISRDDYPEEWGPDDILEIGPDSPIEALQALAGSPEDDEGY